jgi:hypothetical protein
VPARLGVTARARRRHQGRKEKEKIINYDLPCGSHIWGYFIGDLLEHLFQYHKITVMVITNITLLGMKYCELLELL